MTAALHREQRADLLGHVDTAIAELRLAVDAAGTCGPVLAEGYVLLGRALELREVIDAMPETEKERAV